MKSKILKVVKIKSDAKIPKYNDILDAGMDVYSYDECVIKKGESKLISTGIRLELPEFTEAQVRPRSGIALKHSVTVLNSPGTIDEGYRGEVKIILINHGTSDFFVKKHMRIAQIVIKPVLRVDIKEVKELSDSIRGEKGFGSSGVD